MLGLAGVTNLPGPDWPCDSHPSPPPLPQVGDTGWDNRPDCRQRWAGPASNCVEEKKKCLPPPLPFSEFLSLSLSLSLFLSFFPCMFYTSGPFCVLELFLLFSLLFSPHTFSFWRATHNMKNFSIYVSIIRFQAQCCIVRSYNLYCCTQVLCCVSTEEHS